MFAFAAAVDYLEIFSTRTKLGQMPEAIIATLSIMPSAAPPASTTPCVVACLAACQFACLSEQFLWHARHGEAEPSTTTPDNRPMPGKRRRP